MSIDLSSTKNLDINDVLKEHTRAMFAGKLDEILLDSKGPLNFKLQAIHEREYINYIAINVYDSESKKGFQYSHPLVYEYEETDWNLVSKFYEEWKDCFNNWCDDLEEELMKDCGFFT